MKNNEEIFDLFRENEHKLDAPPSPMAWDKLERKLDNKKTAKRKVIWNYYAAAAGILLLVFAGMFYLKDSASTQNTNPTYAQADKSTVIEEAVVEEAKPARPILMSHKEKQFYYNQPVAVNIEDNHGIVNKSPIALAKIKKNRDQVELSKDEFAIKFDTKISTSKPKFFELSDHEIKTPEDKANLLEKADSDGYIQNNIGYGPTKEKYSPSGNSVPPKTAKPKIVSPGAVPPPTTSAPTSVAGSTVSPPIKTEDAKTYAGDDLSEIAEEQLTRSESVQIQTTAAGKSSASKKSDRKKKKKESSDQYFYSPPAPQPSIPSASAEMEEDQEPSTFDEAESYKDIALGSAVQAKPLAKASEETAMPSQAYQISQLSWISGEWINHENNTKEVWDNGSASELIGRIFSTGSNDEWYESDLIQIKRSRGKIILIQQNEIYDLVELTGKKAIFRSQEDRKSTIKITQSGSKLKIVNQRSNNSKTKVLKKE